MKIKALPAEAQRQAWLNFCRPAENQNGGILACANVNGFGAVWLWGEGGLKRYRAGAGTEFLHMKAICDADTLAEEAAAVGLDTSMFDLEGKTLMWQKAYPDVRQWRQAARSGSYVIVSQPEAEGGEAADGVEEIEMFDWLEFLQPSPLCGK